MYWITWQRRVVCMCEEVWIHCNKVVKQELVFQIGFWSYLLRRDKYSQRYEHLEVNRHRPYQYDRQSEQFIMNHKLWRWLIFEKSTHFEDSGTISRHMQLWCNQFFGCQDNSIGTAETNDGGTVFNCFHSIFDLDIHGYKIKKNWYQLPGKYGHLEKMWKRLDHNLTRSSSFSENNKSTVEFEYEWIIEAEGKL